jgi:hypothetical protein
MFAAFILELASTMYIKNVADRSIQMIFWACISPFITLPFAGYMVESKNWGDRIKMAISQAIGYVLGSLIVFML